MDLTKPWLRIQRPDWNIDQSPHFNATIFSFGSRMSVSGHLFLGTGGFKHEKHCFSPEREMSRSSTDIAMVNKAEECTSYHRLALAIQNQGFSGCVFLFSPNSIDDEDLEALNNHQTWEEQLAIPVVMMRVNEGTNISDWDYDNIEIELKLDHVESPPNPENQDEDEEEKGGYPGKSEDVGGDLLSEIFWSEFSSLLFPASTMD